MSVKVALHAGHTGSVFGVSVSAAAPHLVATASDDETVRLWEDAEHAGAWRTTCSAPVADSAMCLNFSPDAALLAAGAAAGKLRVRSYHLLIRLFK